MKNLDELRNQLTARGRRLHKIAMESGISYSWLSKFRHGEINNPTVNRVTQLQRYLDATPEPTVPHAEDRAA